MTPSGIERWLCPSLHPYICFGKECRWNHFKWEILYLNIFTQFWVDNLELSNGILDILKLVEPWPIHLFPTAFHLQVHKGLEAYPGWLRASRGSQLEQVNTSATPHWLSQMYDNLYQENLVSHQHFFQCEEKRINTPLKRQLSLAICESAPDKFTKGFSDPVLLRKYRWKWCRLHMIFQQPSHFLHLLCPSWIFYPVTNGEKNPRGHQYSCSKGALNKSLKRKNK